MNPGGELNLLPFPSNAIEELNRMKPWQIFATFPTLSNRKLGEYSSRACAEQDAQKYKRILGNQITVRVVWTQED